MMGYHNNLQNIVWQNLKRDFTYLNIKKKWGKYIYLTYTEIKK